jgi:hypothetical protein
MFSETMSISRAPKGASSAGEQQIAVAINRYRLARIQDRDRSTFLDKRRSRHAMPVQQIGARIDRRVDPPTGKPDGAARYRLGLGLGAGNFGKAELAGFGDAGHQKVHDLDVVRESKTEARLVQFVKRIEQALHFLFGERLDIGRDFQLVILAEIAHLHTARDHDVGMALRREIGRTFLD